MNCPACGHVSGSLYECPSCGIPYDETVNDWHVTYSGLQFSSTRPRIEDINIKDICMVLSRFPRYLGNTKFMYTVGQHSCYVYDVLLPYGILTLHDAILGMGGITHDGEEAYWCDIPSPYKCLEIFSGYRKVASVLSEMIANVFGCAEASAARIKAADMSVFRSEVDQVASYNPLLAKRAFHYEPAKVGTLFRGLQPLKIRPWSERKVRREFMRRFNTAQNWIEMETARPRYQYNRGYRDDGI